MRFFRRLFKIIFFTIIILIFLMIFHYTKHGYLMYKSALAEMPLEDKISEIQSKENYTKLSEIPQIYIDAVIAVEDHRFYSHNGIDMIAICRATYNDIKAMKFVEGGSTITQQLAKNTFFTQDKKIERKIAEVFMAFKLEQKYSKNEILELYINTTFFGNGYYTVKEASRGYFNKEPLELTDSEAIMLAGIPNAPSLYNPRNSLKLCLERQRQVISKMIKYGKLTKGQDVIKRFQGMTYYKDTHYEHVAKNLFNSGNFTKKEYEIVKDLNKPIKSIEELQHKNKDRNDKGL